MINHAQNRTCFVSLRSWLVSVAIVGVASVGFAKPLDTISYEEIEWRLQELEHVAWNQKVEEKNVSKGWSCITSTLHLEVIDPQTGVARPIAVSLKRPYSEKPVPLVVVLPTIEGSTPLEPEITSNLCGKKMASIVAEISDNSVPEEMPSWGIEDRRNRDSVMAIRTILDYAETDARFDKNKMGLIGLSQGGVTASLLAAVEADRLKAVVMAVGVGNIPYILANSTNSNVSALRDRRMKHLGLASVEQYEDELRQTVKYDPLYFAPLVRTDRLLMVMAQSDTVVPYIAQQEQYEKFGRPSQELYSGGHVGTLIGMTFWYFGAVTDFLKTRFDKPTGVIDSRTFNYRVIE